MRLHDEFLRDEIVEFDEKYYLFGMKSEADLRRGPIFLYYFREYREFRTKIIISKFSKELLWNSPSSLLFSSISWAFY